MQRAHDGLRDVESNPWLLEQEAPDDSRQKGGRDAFGATYTQFSDARVGEKCEFLDALFELVENSPAADDKGAAVGRRLYAPATTVEQAKTEHMLHIRYRFGHC